MTYRTIAEASGNLVTRFLLIIFQRIRLKSGKNKKNPRIPSQLGKFLLYFKY